MRICFCPSFLQIARTKDAGSCISAVKLPQRRGSLTAPFAASLLPQNRDTLTQQNAKLNSPRQRGMAVVVERPTRLAASTLGTKRRCSPTAALPCSLLTANFSPQSQTNQEIKAARRSFYSEGDSLPATQTQLLQSHLSDEEVRELFRIFTEIRSCRQNWLRRILSDKGWGVPGAEQCLTQDCSRRFLRWLVEVVFQFQSQLLASQTPTSFHREGSAPVFEEVKGKAIADLIFALRGGESAKKALLERATCKEVRDLRRATSFFRVAEGKAVPEVPLLHPSKSNWPDDALSTKREISVAAEKFLEDCYAEVLWADDPLPPAAAPLLALFRLALTADLPQILASKNILRLAVRLREDCLRRSSWDNDLTNPLRWFPPRPPRRVYVHLGAPNSGKTWRSLERFVNSSSGVYMAPLRLLAREVFGSVRNRGMKCCLITGQERLEEEGATHVSCTVEAAPLHREFGVAVLDEVQFLADEQRGAAWTRAFLGLRAKELHLCGEARVEGLIRELASFCNDTIVEVEFLSPFKSVQVEDTCWNGWDDARPGDCVIAFSREQVLRQRQLAEESGLRVAVVYGRLPQTVRAQQASLFNNAVQMSVSDGNAEEEGARNHDDESQKPPPFSVMVATDAVGLGLNLNVRRVIFLSLLKPAAGEGGAGKRPLTSSEIRQIASRSGRRGGPFETEGGRVTAVSEEDRRAVAEALQVDPQAEGLQLREAALLPEPWCFELLLDQLHFVSQSQRSAQLLQFASALHSQPPFFVARGAFEAVASICALVEDIPLQSCELAALCQAPLPMKTRGSAQRRNSFATSNIQGRSDDSPRDANSEEVGNAVQNNLQGETEVQNALMENVPLHLQAAIRWFAVSLATAKSASLPPFLRFGEKPQDSAAANPRRVERPPLKSVSPTAPPEAAAAGVGQWGVCADTAEAVGARRSQADSFGFFEDSDIGARDLLNEEFDLEEGEEVFRAGCVGSLKERAPRCSEEDLRAWEAAHQILEVYIWLSIRLPGHFPDRTPAVRAKEQIEEAINAALESSRLDAASCASAEEVEETQTP